jgi:putative transposase
MELAVMKAAVEQIREQFAFSERRACGLMQMAVNTFRYRKADHNAGLRERVIEIAREKPRFGYRRVHVMLGA